MCGISHGLFLLFGFLTMELIVKDKCHDRKAADAAGYKISSRFPLISFYVVNAKVIQLRVFVIFFHLFVELTFEGN